jgi:hypothetical protein
MVVRQVRQGVRQRRAARPTIARSASPRPAPRALPPREWLAPGVAPVGPQPPQLECRRARTSTEFAPKSSTGKFQEKTGATLTDKSARAHIARDQTAHAWGWRLSGWAIDPQLCRGQAAPIRRHGVVDQEISELWAAEGPADERSRHPWARDGCRSAQTNCERLWTLFTAWRCSAQTK